MCQLSSSPNSCMTSKDNTSAGSGGLSGESCCGRKIDVAEPRAYCLTNILNNSDELGILIIVERRKCFVSGGTASGIKQIL
mmetsp:Transcript_15761/g.26320  ORF Transcript_15761/g.26320 Transcript_15761/m.26320 type:complete len:81 (-) Transcript_15761:84-326(-)